MSMHQKNIRIQASLNGRIQATAGLLEHGVIRFHLSWVRRDPTKATERERRAPGFSLQEWMDGNFEISLGGLDATRALFVDWFTRRIAVGDELGIRILPPGEFDPPQCQSPVKVPQRPKWKKPLRFERFRSAANEKRSSGENPRLEVTVNGSIVATASLVDFGVLDFDLAVNFRPADDVDEIEPDSPGTAPNGIRMSLHALDSSRSKNLWWLAEKVTVDDQLVLRVKPPGDIDAPAREMAVGCS